MNHGFIPPVENPEDYIFGSQELGFKFPYEVLQEDGQWDSFLPKFEHQARQGFETANCTGYGTLSALETLLRRKYGIIEDYSERYVGIMAGTEPPGNNPQTVIETIRKESGLIQEQLLPFDDLVKTVEEYYSPKPMSVMLQVEGIKWSERWEVRHEWVKGQNQAELLKAALKHSPLGVSVHAWALDDADGLYFKDEGMEDNHWCVLFGYEDGRYWKVFDSYDSSIKHLKWNYNFGFVKKYYIAKKEARKDNWLIDLFKRLWGN